MLQATRSSDVSRIRAQGQPLKTSADLDPLIDRIGDARFVLLGEATHGTSEFYLWRSRLTQRLITEKGFSLLAVEGDWPDCYRVNRYIRGYNNAGGSAYQVLKTFERWPTWMWANWEVVALVNWLRGRNDGFPPEQRVGFYGLDVYSLWESLNEVTRYLETNAPDALQTAYRAAQCFQPYSEDAQAYAYATRFVPDTCEDEVIELLLETQRNLGRIQQAGDGEAVLNAEQNARIAVDAERYYRAMIRGDGESWNIRDRHMVDTLERLVDHYGPTTKAIVWEHNTHIGDARATPMAEAGMVNVGQLVRERRQDDGVVLVGFGTYKGQVIAGRSWGAPMERMPVDEAQPGSWEGVIHEAVGEDSLFVFADAADDPFATERGHRAIGVVYDPREGQRGGHVPTVLSRRYDAFLYLEESRALHPLHIDAQRIPETYSWGI